MEGYRTMLDLQLTTRCSLVESDRGVPKAHVGRQLGQGQPVQLQSLLLPFRHAL